MENTGTEITEIGDELDTSPPVWLSNERCDTAFPNLVRSAKAKKIVFARNVTKIARCATDSIAKDAPTIPDITFVEFSRTLVVKYAPGVSNTLLVTTWAFWNRRNIAYAAAALAKTASNCTSSSLSDLVTMARFILPGVSMPKETKSVAMIRAAVSLMCMPSTVSIADTSSVVVSVFLRNRSFSSNVSKRTEAGRCSSFHVAFGSFASSVALAVMDRAGIWWTRGRRCCV